MGQSHRDLSAAMDARQRAEPTAVGPATENGRASRIEYWPDRRGTGARQRRAVLQERDPSLLAVGGLAGKSVAVQSLSAFERLLFDHAAKLTAGSAAAEDGYACGLAASVARFQSHLEFIDGVSPAPARVVRLDPVLHKLSIRHIDANGAGVAAFAMQYEGDRRDDVPLVGLLGDGEARLLRPPRSIVRRMRHYTGGIAFDSSGNVLAASSSRGHLVTFWSESGRYLGMAETPDASGLAAALAPRPSW